LRLAELGRCVVEARRIVLLDGEFDQHFSVVERLFQRRDLLEGALVSRERARDAQRPLLIVPEIRCRRLLSQLAELAFLAGDVKGTSWRRRAGSGVP